MLNGKLLKLVDQFTYLCSSISSTESDVNICMGKAWITIDRLLTIWKTVLTKQIKQEFFQAITVSVLQYGCTTYTLMKFLEKKLDRNCRKDSACYFEQILEAAPYKTAAVWPPSSHHTNYPNEMDKRLVGFYGISTFVGYLMSNPFLCK